jgi:hypothetical protein
MEQIFSLRPFLATQLLSSLNLAGTIARAGQRLVIRYEMMGDLTEVAIASRSDTPARKHDLWKNTCFELFFGSKNCDRYWEFNLSPAGHWNVYRFEGYRCGMQEETAFKTLIFSVEQKADSLELVLDINLGQLISTEQTLEIAITAVIKHRNDSVTYWALTHTGAEADFHRRDSFIIEL